MRIDAGHRGLTLIEVIVALAIGSMVALISARLMEMASLRSAVSEREGARAQDKWADWISLRDAAWQVALPMTDSVPVVGNRATAMLRTRCLTAYGWSEPCSVVIAASRRSTVCTLVLVQPAPASYAAPQADRDCHLLYLVEADGGGVWREEWRTPGVLPLGIALVSSTDTSLLRVGPQR